MRDTFFGQYRGIVGMPNTYLVPCIYHLYKLLVQVGTNSAGRCVSVPLARDGRSAPRRNVCVPAGRLLGLARVGCRRSQEHKRALFPAPDDAGA